MTCIIYNIMESMECICENYYMKMILRMINSVLTTTGQVMMNSNTPANDSGYVDNNLNFGSTNPSSVVDSSNNTSGLSTAFYTVLIVIGLMMLMVRGRKGKTSSTLSN